jgi:acetyltransferase-like isoleucine patch superfamily enzyme
VGDGVLRRWLARAISFVRGDVASEFEDQLSYSEVVELLSYRIAQLIRGFVLRVRLNSVSGYLFVGRRVSVRNARQLSLGRGVVLEDDVSIDAMGRQASRFDDGVTIKRAANIVCTAVARQKGLGITIGAHSSIGAGSYLGAQGGIVIGANVLVGPAVMIFSEDHVFADPAQLIRQQGMKRAQVVIEEDCWIGSRVVILRGTRIGRGSVIGAGSVVTHDIPAGSLAVGAPARAVRSRLNSPSKRDVP